MRWSLLIEIGWFGWRPRYERDVLLPAISLWIVRVSWCRGVLLRSVVLWARARTRSES